MAYIVEHKGGQSRYGTVTVDYMLVTVDDVELYAEAPVDDSDEYGTYDELKTEIVRQAQAAGIDISALRFWFDK